MIDMKGFMPHIVRWQNMISPQIDLPVVSKIARKLLFYRIRCTINITRAMAENGSSRSVLGQKRVGRSTKAADTQFGLT